MILSLWIYVDTISFGWSQVEKECWVNAGSIALSKAMIIQIYLAPTLHDVPSTLLTFPPIFSSIES